MARYAKPRSASAKSKPAPAPPKPAVRQRRQESWEDQLFFSRLRGHAKWIFVALAAVFGLGFVVFGVGSGSGVGLFSHNGGGINLHHGGGGISIGSARSGVRNHPNDPEAWRRLATAYQARGRNQQAIEALTRLTALRPRDTDALSSLAVLYLTHAQELRVRVGNAQLQAQTTAPSLGFALDPASAIGRALSQDPVSQAVSSGATSTLADTITRAQAAYDGAVRTYKRLATLEPTNSSLQIQLGQAAEAAGDTQSAIAAYRAFLKIAPDDPSASAVKQRIVQLRAAGSSSGTPSSPSR